MKDGELAGFMSVRTPVGQEDIQQASALYRDMNEGKLHPSNPLPGNIDIYRAAKVSQHRQSDTIALAYS